jgi:hypothetical protein
MSRKSLALVAAGLAVAGCTLNRSDVRREAGTATTLLSRLGGEGGTVIEPKWCALRVWIVSRPVRDRAVHDAVWGAADEQVVPPEVRHDLQANGLRVGVLTGGMPSEVEAAINAPPPDRVNPADFNIPDRSNTLVRLTPAASQASLLLNRDGRAFGRDYHDASGFFRVTASHEGATAVALRFAPELQHGQIARRFSTVPDGVNTLNALEPISIRDSQQEETFRELSATIKLEPGQIAVIGCDPDRRNTLGTFLFTQPEPNSDRLIQKVILISASRNNPGPPGSQPGPPVLTPVDPPDLASTPARKPEPAKGAADPDAKTSKTPAADDRKPDKPSPP